MAASVPAPLTLSMRGTRLSEYYLKRFGRCSLVFRLKPNAEPTPPFPYFLEANDPGFGYLSRNEAVLHGVRVKLLYQLLLRWIYREQPVVRRTGCGVDKFIFLLLKHDNIQYVT